MTFKDLVAIDPRWAVVGKLPQTAPFDVSSGEPVTQRTPADCVAFAIAHEGEDGLSVERTVVRQCDYYDEHLADEAATGGMEEDIAAQAAAEEA